LEYSGYFSYFLFNGISVAHSYLKNKELKNTLRLLSIQERKCCRRKSKDEMTESIAKEENK